MTDFIGHVIALLMCWRYNQSRFAFGYCGNKFIRHGIYGLHRVNLFNRPDFLQMPESLAYIAIRQGLHSVFVTMIALSVNLADMGRFYTSNRIQNAQGIATDNTCMLSCVTAQYNPCIMFFGKCE